MRGPGRGSRAADPRRQTAAVVSSRSRSTYLLLVERSPLVASPRGTQRPRESHRLPRRTGTWGRKARGGQLEEQDARVARVLAYRMASCLSVGAPSRPK